MEDTFPDVGSMSDEELKELIADQSDVGPIRDQLLFDAPAAA